MTKTAIWIVIIALVVVAVAGYFIYSSGSSVAPVQTQTPPSNSVENNNIQHSQFSPSPRSYNIDIKNFAFSPSTLEIYEGDSITWTNMDSASHTVTSDSGSELSSGTMNGGKTYTHTLDGAGTYDYHCAFHPNMKAMIVVAVRPM